MPQAGLSAVPRVLLFDLDGTLIDSAPDLAGAANEMLASRGRAPLPLQALRPHGGSGARGMLGVAFGVRPGQADYEALRDEFLDRYEARMMRATQVFDGVAPLLARLEERAVAWGIVTHKASRFAAPLVQALGLKPACLVAGDSTPHTKPHPAPLLEAARRLGVDPAACVYVGDDERDMQAAHAAGMQAWAAAWGYLGCTAGIDAWGAHAVIDSPAQLWRHVNLA